MLQGVIEEHKKEGSNSSRENGPSLLRIYLTGSCCVSWSQCLRSDTIAGNLQGGRLWSHMSLWRFERESSRFRNSTTVEEATWGPSPARLVMIELRRFDIVHMEMMTEREMAMNVKASGWNYLPGWPLVSGGCIAMLDISLTCLPINWYRLAPQLVIRSCSARTCDTNFIHFHPIKQFGQTSEED